MIFSFIDGVLSFQQGPLRGFEAGPVLIIYV